MNKAVIIGNLVRPPEKKVTPSGVSVCNFTVAVQRRFKNQAGEREADFIPVVVWRGQADNCEKYLDKGSQVAVTGSIQTRSYDAQDGTKRYITEIIADEVQFLSRTKAGGSGASGEVSGEPPLMEEIDEDLPF